MRLTYCMTSNCPQARDCQRYEDDAASHSLQRTYADFSEELIRQGDKLACPFFLEKSPLPSPR